jgi:L-alanine-DL-glutamate epimerase-like enolase superfamily enzyme
VKITDVKAHVLLDPAYDREATSSNQDTIVVEVTTDEGLTGYGETDLNAWVARACIEAPGTHTMDRGIRESLLGRDPRDPEALWDELYVGTAMTGRRGAAVNALGAVDIAMWDIAGQAAGVPTWQLLGDAAHDHLTPYASLLPTSRGSVDGFVTTLVEQAAWAKGLGFRAAKLEILTRGPYAHEGLSAPDSIMLETIAAVRQAVGPDFAIMVDVAYAWKTADEVLAVVEDWAEHDVFFLETPLWSDDLDELARLCERSPIPIAAGEWLSTRFEFLDLMDRGGVHVVQPDVGRVGGLTEALRVCRLAEERGRIVVPHGWKTGLTVAATAQLASVAPTLRFFEFVPQEVAESPLRRELVRDELTLENGLLGLPARPGLGVVPEPEAMERFTDAARRKETSWHR